MKSMLVHAYGEPGDLVCEETVVRAPGAGEVRVKVKACGINFADGLLLAGKYQVKPEFPFGPGFEVAGIVDELGAGVEGFGVGDRVVGLPDHSGCAEQMVLPAARLTRLPAAVPFEVGAAVPIVYLTSYLSLVHKAGLQRGDVLVVHGASGGVGLTAVELGHRLGARVLACASSAEKLAIAQSYGADALINSTTEDVRERIKALTDQRGADVIYDPVGGEAFAASLRAINFEGRILTLGFASGEVPQIPANIVMVKSIDILGLNFGGYLKHRPDLVSSSLEQVFQWVAEGSVRPLVSERFAFAQTADAIAHVQARRAKGKVVVVMD